MKKPNILLITSDQHRADSLGCYGHPCVQTPHLDQLAYEGIRFENAYSDCPVCIPARTTMITGIQSHVYGSPSYNENYRIARQREKFLGSLITAAGYQTQLVGKTHWHTEPSFRGGFEAVTWLSRYRKEELIKTGRSFNPTGIGFNELNPTMSELPPALHNTNWIVDRCIEFLETRERQQPFFLWASFQDPHPPFVIHEPYYSMYDNDEIPEPILSEWSKGEDCPVAHYKEQYAMKTGLMSARQLRKARSVYYGMITNLDYQLGRLFGKIMHDDDWENTLVIYTSDHGEFLGDHGCGKKSSFCEAAARIPFIIRPPHWMKLQPGRLCECLVELADILPTLCVYAGVAVPEDVTGKSLKGIVDGEDKSVRDTLHGHIGGIHMYHDGKYKYIYYVDDGSEYVFDVSKDRNDTEPIKGEIVKEMRQKLIKHFEEEGHEHLVNGELLNLHKKKPSVQVARAQDGAALQPLASLHNICRKIQHIH